MFDAHQIIFSENIPSESFYPGPQGLKMTTFPEFQRLTSRFPKLKYIGCLDAAIEHYGPQARSFLKRKDVDQVCQNLKAKKRHLGKVIADRGEHLRHAKVGHLCRDTDSFAKALCA
jgi:hypothetical protein